MPLRKGISIRGPHKSRNRDAKMVIARKEYALKAPESEIRIPARTLSPKKLTEVSKNLRSFANQIEKSKSTMVTVGLKPSNGTRKRMPTAVLFK